MTDSKKKEKNNRVTHRFRMKVYQNTHTAFSFLDLITFHLLHRRLVLVLIEEIIYSMYLALLDRFRCPHIFTKST